MTPTTREHALAAMKQAGLEKRVDMDSLFRFWSLAMEHAAGIAEKTMPRYNWASENADIYHAQNHMLSRAVVAIRQAAK